MARVAREAAFLVSVLVAISFVVSAAQPTTEDFPSQVAPPAGKPASGFWFPNQLWMFANLEKYAGEVLRDISARNFSSANASLVNYSTVVNEFFRYHNITEASKGVGAGNNTVFSAMTTSQALYSQLILKSKSYDGLFVASTTGENSSNENQTIKNAVAMKGLNSDIKALRDQINATNDVIFGPAVDEGGLDMSDYAIAHTTFDTYVTLIDNQLTNVTNVAFQNTTTTIFLDRNTARYADYIRINGTVEGAQTGVANGTVTIMERRQPVATVKTNTSGSYEYDFFVDGRFPGSFQINARYEPLDQPYEASSSKNVTLSVENITATNTLRVSQGSLLGNSVTLAGTVATNREPVKNATIALYVDGKAATYAKTDANGTYQLDHSISTVEYLGSLFRPNGETFYTVFLPVGHPLSEARSDVITQPLLGTYVTSFFGSSVGIAATAIVMLGAVLATSVRVQQAARRAASTETAMLETKARTPSELTDALPIGLESGAEVAQETRHNVQDVINQVRHLSGVQDNKGAVIAAYRGALAIIVQQGDVVIKPSLSHWETYALIKKSTPDARTFRELTYLYELASYSGGKMTGTHVEMALKSLTAIDSLAQGTDGEL